MALSVAAVVGIAILIISSQDTQRTLYELIAFIVGICAIAMAILEQLNSRRLERRLDRMQSQLALLIKEEHQDEVDGRYVRERLTDILTNQKRKPRDKSPRQ